MLSFVYLTHINLFAFNLSLIFANVQAYLMNTTNPYEPQPITPLSQFGILLGLLGAGLVLASIVSAGMMLVSINTPLTQMETEIMKPEHTDLLRWMQFVATLIMFAFPALVFATIVNRKPFPYLGFNARANYKQVFIVAVIAFSALYAQSFFSSLNEMIPIPKSWAVAFKTADEKYNTQVLAMAKMNSFGDYMLSLIMLALLPAIFEEMLFRGALQQVLIKLFRNAFVGILFTSLIFSAVHMSWAGFLTRAFLGMVLGYIFYYGKNIWLNILLHFINNGVVVTVLYFLSMKGKITEADMKDEEYPIYIGIFALVAVLGFMFFLKRESLNVVGKTNNNKALNEDVEDITIPS